VHDGVVGTQSTFVRSVGIRGTENYIALAVIGDYDVLVAAACSDGESPCVVSVKLDKWGICDRACL
jgi:hypothetical protein